MIKILQQILVSVTVLWVYFYFIFVGRKIVLKI